jgi:hypothetical protein
MSVLTTDDRAALADGRITPEASCYTKRTYYSEKAARRVIHDRREAAGVELRAYACGFCGGYHLTKRVVA